MQTITRNTLKLAVALVVLVALFGAGFHSSVAHAASCTPIDPPMNLYATTGTATLFGSTSIPIWGYSSLNVPGSATLPGLTLDVNEGDCVEVVLHNVDIPEATSLLFQGQDMIPDTTGVTAGNSISYIFSASSAGTFLYEAGLIANAQHQVAMGMYGALIVRPAVPFATVTGTNMLEDPSGTTLTDSAAAFTQELVGGTLVNDTDGSSCTIATFTGTTLTCAAPLNGGTNNVWALADTYTAAANYAYNMGTTAYNDEALLVLSEIDPALNNNASPDAFDMRNYSPQYFLINGKAYPDTAALAGNPGEKVLMRYVNAGLQAHAMSTLGLSQTIIAQDGEPYVYSHHVVAESIATGQTLDTLVTVPPSALEGDQFAVFDANMLLRNTNAAGFGGMMTFLAVGAGAPPPPADTGPTISSLSLSPNPTNGSVNVTVSATATDGGTTPTAIVAAEFYIDGTTNASNAMTASDGTFDATSEAVEGTISAATLAGLSSENHNIYARAQDANGYWGPFVSTVLNLDKTGPTTTGLSLAPNPSDGSVLVALTTTGNDTASGGSNVTAAEYWIGTDPGEGLADPMTIVAGAAAPIRQFTATIPAGISQGTHVVSVRSQDAFGNWGAVNTINLIVGDTQPPTSSIVDVQPNPTNGLVGYNTSVLAVRVLANFSDVASGGSNIVAAEGFIDTIASTGTGFVFIATDGTFNSPSELGYADIPLASVRALSDGNHPIYVHAKDAAGNWNTTDYSTINLVIDKSIPTFTSISLAPNPTNGATTVVLTVNGAVDPLVNGFSTGVTGGEYWFGTTDPTPGGGTQFNGTTANIDVSTLAVGTYTVSARIHDAVGNWSTVHSATLTVVPDEIFADGFESGNTDAWSSRSTNSTGRLNVTNGAALVGNWGLQAMGNNSNYVQYNFGTVANPASATFDARFYFRPNGNNSTGKDIFSAATTSGFGTTLFRVRYRLSSGTPQVQIQLGTSNANPTWTNILGGTASNTIEVVLQAAVNGGPNGTLRLYVNGTLAQTLTTTSTGSVGAFRMGSVTSTGNNTALYFDAFAAKRTVATLIGP